jgi:hypothetical protein
MRSSEEGNVYENECQYGTGGAEQQDVADIMSGYALPYLVGCRVCLGEFIRLPRQGLRVWHVLLQFIWGLELQDFARARRTLSCVLSSSCSTACSIFFRSGGTESNGCGAESFLLPDMAATFLSKAGL